MLFFGRSYLAPVSADISVWRSGSADVHCIVAFVVLIFLRLAYSPNAMKVVAQCRGPCVVVFISFRERL